MFYAFAFAFFALALAWAAVEHSGPAYLLLWPAVSFLAVAAGYAMLGSAIFGKRPNGTRSRWATLLLLPYLAFSWSTWSLRRCIVRDACASRIADGIWLGRRPYLHELPEEVRCIVDLTCEFTAAGGITSDRSYICLPTLDTCTPSPDLLLATVQQVATCPGGIYIHCAAGHGRSAMFTAALLIARGLASDPDSAIALIRTARPAIHLSPAQCRLLQQFHSQFRQPA